FYKGLTPLWARQVPYTMMKFASFERTVEYIYKTVGKPKEDYNKLEQLGVSFLGGYIAGVFCAIVSHPADTMVSKLNNIKKAEGESTAALSMKILKDLGPLGIWRGLGTRVIMIGTLTALQWLIYDYVKVFSGLPTTGSEKKNQVGFRGVRKSGHYLAEAQDDIHWILLSHGLELNDAVDEVLETLESELYFW
ncbi:14514_t:CDS:2, partial [Acaulospora morrowiae]